MRIEIIFVGSGGQGIILGGHILAEAAGIYDEKMVANSERYGAAARGQVSVSEVVISDRDIDYPKVTNADCMICLSQDGYDTYKYLLKKSAVIIADSFYVKNIEHKNVHIIPLSRVVMDKTGSEIGTNIAALGSLVRITGMVSERAMREAIRTKVPRGTEEFNLKIFKIGLGDIPEEIRSSEREQDLQEEYISILESDVE